MTQSDQQNSLESMFANVETASESLLKASAAVSTNLKRLRKAANVGDLRELKKNIESASLTIQALQMQMKGSENEVLAFDEEGYFSSGRFTTELVKFSKEAGVKLFQQDDRLYCYPFLLRVSPSDRTLLIGKMREKRIRPSFLSKELLSLQTKPARFKPEAFLEAIFTAYTLAISLKGDPGSRDKVISLTEIYRILTVLPGQSKEYPLAEFGRDVHLLDRSNVETTKAGARVQFSGSTATKVGGSPVSVVTESGQEKKYYGISFSAHQRSLTP